MRAARDRPEVSRHSAPGAHRILYRAGEGRPSMLHRSRAGRAGAGSVDRVGNKPSSLCDRAIDESSTHCSRRRLHFLEHLSVVEPVPNDSSIGLRPFPSAPPRGDARPSFPLLLKQPFQNSKDGRCFAGSWSSGNDGKGNWPGLFHDGRGLRSVARSSLGPVSGGFIPGASPANRR